MLIDPKIYYTKARLGALLQEGLGDGISVHFDDQKEVVVYTQNIDAEDSTLNSLSGVYRFPAHFITIWDGAEFTDYVKIDTQTTLRASCAATSPSCDCRPGGSFCADCML
jgi:hypothetical protein